jgi:plastocyanin
MKKYIGLSSKMSSGIAFFVILLAVSGGCQKVSDTNNPGGNPGGTPGPGASEVFIQGLAFNPSSITVAANTTVTWTNKDGVSHTVTSNTGLFDSGLISTNGTFSFKFTAAGTYPYHCTPHPSMTATVNAN